MISRNSFNPDDQEDSGLPGQRTQEEIDEQIGELFDKIWYNRHKDLEQAIEDGEEECDPQIWKDAEINARKIEAKYGIDNLGPYDDFEWGMLNGKLSALRWLVGFEWDMLDT